MFFKRMFFKQARRLEMRWLAQAACVLTVALAGCAVAPTHPALQATATAPGLTAAPLLPVRSFVADLDSSGAYQISPDGYKLMWSGRLGLGPGLFVKDLASGATRSFAVRSAGIWAKDSRHVIIHLDAGGDENSHVMLLDTEAPTFSLKDLTPFGRARSFLHARLDDGDDLLIQSNRRDAKVFDLYRYSVASGELKLLAQNPGDVGLWLTDSNGQLHGRATSREGRWAFETPAAPGATTVSTPGAKDGPDAGAGTETKPAWQHRFAVDALETVRPLRLSQDASFIWALSDRGRDKQALVKLFLDGREELVFADERVDVSGVLFSRRQHLPLAVSLEPGQQEWHFLDAELGRVAKRLTGSGPARLTFWGMSDDDSLLVANITRRDGGEYVLVRRASEQVERLAEMSRSRLHARSPLAPTTPLSFKSRDGLTLHAYLTTPVAPAGKPLPTVVYVHGGPWARDVHLAGNPMLDFLANRGYAVLQVNYRGSTGYGRQFRDAAMGEFAGAMHSDLIDGLDEVIRRGVTDPKRVAIMGASYGGYASLVGMTFTPDRFACGISTVGMSDLTRLLEQAPPYWELGLPMWRRFVGHEADPVQREQMKQRSPLFRAADAQGPILLMHGAHDPRVKLEQSQRMAQALQAAGKPHALHVFDKAGHGFQRWQDRMRSFRLTEDFLAQCLGGRSGGFDFFEIGAWLL